MSDRGEQQRIVPRGAHAEIAMLYTGGATLQEIGNVVGVTRERVRQILRADGIAVRTCRREIGSILRAYDPNKTTREIATEAGRDPATTGRTLNALGLSRRDGRSGKQKWTCDMIIARLQDWARVHGRQPVAPDLLYGRPTRSGYPSANTVQRYFGSWNAGVRAAGFEPLGVGHKLSERP